MSDSSSVPVVAVVADPGVVVVADNVANVSETVVDASKSKKSEGKGKSKGRSKSEKSSGVNVLTKSAKIIKSDRVARLKSQKPGKVSSAAAKAKQISSTHHYIRKPAIKRLARRAGVKRLSDETYKVTLQIANDFVKNVIKNSLLMTQYAGRKTVTTRDVLFALKQTQQVM